MFSNFIGEYDWHNRAGAFDFPYPGPAEELLRFYQPVNTVPALSAAMAWARITSLDTIDRPQGIQSSMLRSLTGYPKSANDIITMKTVPTLPRSPLLILILLLNPFIAVSCVFMKALLYHSPMGDDFNLISLLATAKDSDLTVLKGASLTGTLQEKVFVNFSIVNDHTDFGDNNRVILSLNNKGANGRIESHSVYE